tara:strand:- start:345 stop:512 length:168 start_codon:yes stop_codon:yes gene_type:complete
MAWDSAHEFIVCTTKAVRRNYISEVENEENRQKVTEISKMITSYKNYLKKRINER